MTMTSPQAASRADESTMINTSLRMPAGTLRRLREYAEQRQTTPSDLMRQWVELGLAEDTRMISLSEAVRALSGLVRG